MARVYDSTVGTASADERDTLLRTIETLERQRHVLGERAIEVALAPLRAKLVALGERAGSTILPPARESECKVVSVLFADIAGFTEMSERLGSEATVDIVNGLFDRLVPVIERYGGNVDKFIGDEIMAVFGAPRAAEHHVEHALRAALDMSAALAEYNRDRKLELGLHIGVNSGTVVAGDVGSVSRRDYSVTGDTVNVAARLEGVARAGETLVGPSTFRHAVQTFDFEPLPVLALKGKSRPTAVYRLLDSKRRRARTPPDGLELAFSGRAEELQTLLARAIESDGARGGAIGIMADPGVGKSRLLLELKDHVGTRVRWLEANGYDYRSEVSYSVVRELIDALTNVANASDENEVRTAYLDYLDALGGERPADIRPYLLRLRGFALDDASERALGEPAPDVLRERMTEATAQLFADAALKQRIVLRIEDLHWADASSIALLRGLAGHPKLHNVLILFTTRPEAGLAREWIEQLRTQSGAQRVIDLHPLPDAIVRSLLDDAFGADQASLAISEEIRAKAQGNPFYLVSFLRSLVDDGVAELRDGRLAVVGDVGRLRVPESLHAAVGARIDKLPPLAKQVLRWGSILGSVFIPGQVARISRAERGSGDIDLLVSLLVERQLVEGDADNRLRFVHAVVHDVAYEGMLARDRRRVHGVVARFLEDDLNETSEADVALLAWHHECAGNRQAASIRYEQASKLAAKTFANREELQYLQSARALADVDDTARMRALVERIGDVLQVTGRFGEAAERFESIRDRAKTPTIDQARIQRKIAKTWTSRQRFEEANAAIAEARDLLERIDEHSSGERWWREHFAFELFAMWAAYMQTRVPEMAAMAERLAPEIEAHATLGERGVYHRSVVLLKLRQQRYRPDPPTVALAARAADELRRAGDTTEICLASFGIGFAQLWSGAVKEADESLQATLRDTTRIGDAERNMLCLTYLAVSARELHDVDRAEAFAHAAMAASARNGARHYEGVAHANLSWVAWRRGDAASADEHARIARSTAVLPGYPFNWMHEFVSFARALERSDFAGAVESVRAMAHPSQQLLHSGVQEALEAAAVTPTPETTSALFDIATRVGYL